MADKETPTEAEKTVPAAEPQPTISDQPRAAHKSDKDIGEWKFEAWSGMARWVNPETREVSFNEKYVRKVARK